MRVGLPREVKDGEFRVALSPSGVRGLPCEVVVEPGAGAEAGFRDQQYREAGAILGNPWQCDLVVKVKELQPAEYRLPQPGQIVFGFQHFGPDPELLDAALACGATFIAFETVGERSGLPILSPMSAIAGRLAVQAGAWCLQKQNGGSGVLLSGLEGIPPGKVVILGAGNVGANALAIAHGLGASISLFARTGRRFPAMKARYPDVLFGTDLRSEIVADADLVVAGVLMPGQLSPKLISRGMLRAMRPGSALVDVGIDQGGVAETSRPTTHSAPIYLEESVVHYCVPNMPAACARTASLALERAVLPFVLKIVNGENDEALQTGRQVHAGRIVHRQLAHDTRRACAPA